MLDKGSLRWVFASTCLTARDSQSFCPVPLDGFRNELAQRSHGVGTLSQDWLQFDPARVPETHIAALPHDVGVHIHHRSLQFRAIFQLSDAVHSLWGGLPFPS
jgi:hypothetical protein